LYNTVDLWNFWYIQMSSNYLILLMGVENDIWTANIAPAMTVFLLGRPA